MERDRRGVPDLTSTIATVECLVESNRDSSKLRGKKNYDDSDNDGDRDKSPRRDKPTIFKDKGRDKKDETPRNFLCNEPHWVLECSKCRTLATLVMEEETHEE